jgi:uncharacterized metal-binding protein
MSETCSCGCNGVSLVYTCSGAANTGLLADRVARKIMKDGCAKMTCLAGVGAGISGFKKSGRAADKNIIIDGCAVACGKTMFENSKITRFDHYMLTDYGVVKGKTEITDELVGQITDKIMSEAFYAQ